MKSALRKSVGKWLRLALVMLLPLHAGFAQAAMGALVPEDAVATAIVQAPVADAQLMPDGMPCHHEAQAPAASDHPAGHTPAGHKDGCCHAGNCHCVAACGISFPVTRVKPQPVSLEFPFSCLSAPAAALPPDLRPPIR